MYKYFALVAIFALSACQPGSDAPAGPGAAESADPRQQSGDARTAGEHLAAVLAAQPEETKARYAYRHPRETLEFFGVKPGMTVVEGLPGRGWYSKILLPYLGPEGRLIGANYAMDMWPNFAFANEEFLKTQATWVTDWPAGAEEWRGSDGASVAAFNFGAMPESMAGTADAVLLVRALHNAVRFASVRDFAGEMLSDAYTVLKPGGILGIVQHHARDDMSDEFADGNHGYLKKDFVIALAENAGFEFVAESDINANPLDRPSEDDVVWRLPPSLGTSRDNPELRAELEAVGESNRMTLKFVKPL